MVIIKFMGGLGNQMFQYSLYRWFETRKVEVRADLQFYARKSAMYQLKNLFDIDVREATREEILCCGDFSKTIFSRLRRRIIGYKKSHVIENVEKLYDFSQKTSLYLDGYWQNAVYFDSIKEDISVVFRKEYKFNEYQWDMLERIRYTNSVSIHIRRGDYLSADNVKIYGGICTEAYYNSAVDYFCRKYGSVKFFVFTNDVSWAKKFFASADNAVYCIVDSSDDSDMFLMAECKHNIMANSSYSWWAAWLNRNPDKIVIAPSVWLNTVNQRGVYCDEWMLINPQGELVSRV